MSKQLQVSARLQELAKKLAEMKQKSVVVGIPKSKEAKDGEISNIELAMIHEFGAVINHPGGTGYSKNGNGKTKFVSNSFVGPVQGRTGAHVIVIPERSFLRSTAKEKKQEISNLASEAFKAAIKNGGSIHDAYATVGTYVASEVREVFGSDSLEPNAKSTINRKGSDAPLIDTGKLQASITYEVRDNES